MTAWELPVTAVLGEKRLALNTDYRDILEVLGWLGGTRGAAYTVGERWYLAMRLFYRGFEEVDAAQYGEAARYLACFLEGGRQAAARPGAPRLLDWEQDAALIVAGVNKVAGCEIRALPYLHWWTFLAWFSAMGEGALSTVLAIRAKKQSGKKLEKWEQDYCREHREEVELRPQRTPEEEAERARLKALLGE